MNQAAPTAPASAPPIWESPDRRGFIRIEKVSKTFGDFVAVDDVSIDIGRGELFSLLGGSGCGKTTLLRMLAGFETPSSGGIFIDGEDVTEMPPYERPVNMMFQSYALFPHMNVAKNIAYGLKFDRLAPAEITQRVDDMLALVQLQPFAERKPHQLSGGQRQRVALARALVKKPKVLLLDEPLGALDKKLREQTQFELMNIQDQTGVSFIVVTHDQEEAMILSTRIAVMNQGKIMQIGEPTEVYERPQSKFIADFIGATNLFAGELAENNRMHCSDLDGDVTVIFGDDTAAAGSSIWLSVRPEKITIDKTRQDDNERNVISGMVDNLAYRGNFSVYQVKTANGHMVQVTTPNSHALQQHAISWDEQVYLSWHPKDAVVLTR